MGIDVHMYVKAKRELAEQELMDLNYRFKEACSIGYGDFPITRSSYWELPEHCYAVDTLSHYYGPSYARGSFPEILMAIKWLQHNIGDVHYGGDSSGLEDTLLWTPELEKEYMDYWLENGGIEYRDSVYGVFDVALSNLFVASRYNNVAFYRIDSPLALFILNLVDKVTSMEGFQISHMP